MNFNDPNLDIYQVIQDEMEQSLDIDTFKNMFEQDEDDGKKVDENPRANMFITESSYIYVELMETQTGEQAISFFAKHGASSPVKFLNCNRATVGLDEFRPYDLTVTLDDSELNEEYFTISSKGVVHICPNKKSKYSKELMNAEDIVPTEFFPLSEWMQQSTMFNVLTSMNFFKHYLIGKVFNLWKGNVRYKKFMNTRQQLAKNLIYSRPAFIPAFMDVNKLLLNMSLVKTFTPLQEKPTYETTDFEQDQKKERETAKSHYEEQVNAIIKRLDSLTKEVSDSRNIQEDEDFEHTKIGQRVKHKSMVLQKEEDNLKKRVIKISKRNYASIGTFIRLVDYMVVETQVKINQTSIDLIYTGMMEKGRKHAISSHIQYDTNSIVFNPTQDEFISQFEQIQGNMLTVAGDVEKVVLNSAFSTYVQGLVSDGGPKFRQIVEDSSDYVDTKEKIKQKLINDFKELSVQAEELEKCREVNNFDQTFRFEDFRTQNHDLEYIKALLENLKKWEHDVNIHIKNYIIRGYIAMSGRKIKSQLSNKVRDELSNVRSYLNELAEQKATEISKGYTHINNTLSKPYQGLTEFVEYVLSVQSSDADSIKLSQEKKKLEEMYGILRRHKAKDEAFGGGGNLLQVKMEDITTKQTQIIGVIQNAVEACEAEKEEMNNALNQNISDVKEKMVEQIGKINVESLIQAVTLPSAALQELNKLKKRFNDLRDRATTYQEYKRVLQQDVPEINEIKEFDTKWDLRNMLWDRRNTWDEDYKHWRYDNFVEQVDAMEVESKVKEYLRDCVQLKQKLAKDQKDEVLEKLTTDVQEVNSDLELILSLGNKALLSQHWIKIFKAFPEPQSFVQTKSYSFKDYISYDAREVKERIAEISAIASGEKGIHDQLIEIQNLWKQTYFVVANYRDMKDRYILGTVEEITMQLEDHQVSIQTMLGSKYVQDIREEVEEWEKKLSYISDVIDEWLSCQRQWMYLENIFSAEDIQKQLPNEAKLFQGVDKFWKDTMIRCHKNALILDCCASDGLLHRFQNANHSLDEIQKCLEDYLETKRGAFPRFYFLSNDEMLEILSQTRNPQAVQPHLRKCFDNMARIEFTDVKNSNEIVGMESAEKEKVPFHASVFAQGNVEFWLSNIEKMMVETLYNVTKDAHEGYPEDAIDRREWLFQYPAQPILTIDQTIWTKNCTQAIFDIEKGRNKRALEEFLEFTLAQLAKMVELVRGDLTGLQRTMMGALIVIDVHARQVVRDMIDKRVSNLNDFEWTKLLRYYWEEEEDDCFAKQTNTRFRYGYEYLGNGPRLVITPLTDKCYMTLTGALHLNYGGSPQGPAGTGKTETTKDLAKALAIQCVVFNCSGSLDYKMMARFFSGLSQGGAWACFDEFNRIDIEVLSVIAQQILTIQNAIKENKDEFEFNGKLIPLNRRFGVFITMNPGYAGRTELPDNLKALFRPVAMMIPDYRLIAEIILFSEGFETAFDLSKKMVQLYKLSSEQLSKQDHYDFGMRAVKSVLVMAGSLRRKDESMAENIVLIRAMRDSNVPKFLEHDLPLFGGIVNDLFPGVDVPKVDYGQLQVKIEEKLRDKSYQTPFSYVNKIIQLLETMIVRHGIMIVGTTGTGKTTCSDILGRALTQLHKEGSKDPMHVEVNQFRLNPKSVTMGELYGYSDIMTNEWTEGLISKLVKDAVEAVNLNKKWIIFDGPVDAIWIENMNTVLDDNKTLCLANGQRIKLPNTLSMVFEVNDLKVASPATVSRCGMVYLEPVHLGWEPLIETWKEKMTEKFPNHINQIADNIKTLFKDAMGYVREECKEIIPSVDSNLAQSCLNIIEQFLNPQTLDLNKVVSAEKVIAVYLVFAIIWSVGANLHDSSRKNFHRFLKIKMTSIYSDFPEGGEVFDYGVDTTSHKFVQWAESIPPFEFNPEQSFFDILVPTTDTVKYKYILDLLIKSGNNVLISGDTGVGKSVIVQDYLAHSDDSIVSGAINFSGKTSSNNLKDALEAKLIKKRKTLLGPPGGKRQVFFIDDVNMPQPDEFGSQPPVELLRQTIDSKGFYDTHKLIFKNVMDTNFICGCAPPGGGRNEVTPRLFRHFNMVWIPLLSQRSMEQIFTSILSGFLSSSPLDMFADSIVRASVEIYNTICVDFLPTPAKCHYTFNLRDLSKVVQGILAVEIANLPDKDMLVYLWVHETFRVFRDRLVDAEDRAKFTDIVHEMLKKYLDMEWEIADYTDVLFGDYDNGEQHYIKLGDTNSLNARLHDALEMYNSQSSTQMNLVFFDDAISHLTRVARIIRSQRGNALLVGVGGSGRRSLAQLGASILDQKNFQIEITKNYREKEWHENLRDLLRDVGVEGNPTSFIFSDTQIVFPSFLEDINNILNAGEVPNLFPADEIEAIFGDLRAEAKKQGKESRDQVLAWFVSRCREMLHIVLTFSPVGEGFRDRCRQFPSIINCCTIDWYNPWPEEALYSVAERFYKEHAELGIGEYQDALCKMSVEIHESVKTMSDEFYEELRRKVYTTPTSYLELIKTYLEMLKVQTTIVPQKVNKYKQGLTRLKETNVIVDELQKMLIKLRPEIDQKEEDTQKLMVTLEKEQKAAAETEKVFQIEAQTSQKLFDEVQTMKQDCEADLEKAMPIYRSALSALNTLKKGDIIEMKSYPKPPEEIVMLMGAVCLLMGTKKEDWAEAKLLMNEPQKFLDSLKNYNKENIPDKLINKLKKYIKMPKFKPEILEKKSNAAKSICLWVIAIYNFSGVMKIIKPKKAQLAEAEAKMKVAKDELTKKQASLDQIKMQIDKLKRDFQDNRTKLDNLTQQKNLIEIQLGRAEKLVNGLASESVRWEKSAAELEIDLKNMVGNIMVAAACVSYIGPFTNKYRQELMEIWKKCCREKNIPLSDDFTIERILSDPIQLREFGIQGLPADNLSIENGIYVTNAKRWPLMIDPQSQANKWIKNMEKDNNLKIIKLSEAKFLQTVENAIRVGAPVLLENIDEHLDPGLEPVLQKAVFRRGGQLLLRLGDNDIPYSQDFKLYITTKWSNPHYLPEVCIKVTIINFTVTMDGLEDQLLVDVVGYEQPELEEQRDKLVVQLSDFKRELQEIESKILQLVAEASADILNDEELIITLDQSKSTSTLINERMAEAEITAKTINENRELYRPVAIRGSILYFVIADLANIDPMYQYSLEFFQKLFNRRLDRSEKAEELEKRLEILKNDVTESFFINICRGLFEKDKLLYAFLNASSIIRRDNRINLDEWNYYLRGSVKKYDEESPHDWLSQEVFHALIGLEESHANFNGLQKSVSDPADSVYWKDIITSDEPWILNLPTQYEDNLTNFQKLMVLKILRVEKLMFFVKDFVKAELGEKFIESPPFDLKAAYGDSGNTTPIIFVLSPGADPIPYLMNLAKDTGMDGERLRIISLGQGQGPIASKLIDLGQQNGDWVCLQNCHLSASWMPELEKIQEKQDENQTHPEYRLWLTSMPSDHFPVPVLQSGIKITNEPPKGLKANLKRTFQEVQEADFESCTKSREYKKLLFALGYFHAVILERRKFGAIGWNIPYSWMQSDFMISKAQVKMFLDEQPDVPYVALNYLVSETNYGGRVTDDKDVRLIKALLKRYFCPDILRDDYKLSNLDTYYAPPEGSLDQSQDYINSLPLDDDPEIFGLHPNANITFQQKTVKEFHDTIISIQPRVSGGSAAITPEEIVEKIAQEYEGKLPEMLKLKKAHADTFLRDENGDMISLGVFVGQEIDRFNILLAVIKSSLINLQKAIKGTVVMSAELERMFNNFLDKKVPVIWEKVAYPSLKPLGSWFEDLLLRFEFIGDWLYNGPPQSFWLPAFFFPQGFMTASLQTHARQHHIPIDTLQFRTNIKDIYKDSIEEQPESGVNIHGLFMQGAQFSKTDAKIRDSEPGKLFIEMPVIWLEPVLDSVKLDDKAYDCPLYKTSLRQGELSTTGHSTNFILFLKVPSDTKQEYWINRGVALLCQLDY